MPMVPQDDGYRYQRNTSYSNSYVVRQSATDHNRYPEHTKMMRGGGGGVGSMVPSFGGNAASSMRDGSKRSKGPAYRVEHLATFGVGPQFGLLQPSDGIRKLKQMEQSSAMWAQRMVLRLQPDAIVVEDDNETPVEQFALKYVREPTAYTSNDPKDVYNNLLVFVVEQDKSKMSRIPAEMHIFQGSDISARNIVDNIKMYIQGRYDLDLNRDMPASPNLAYANGDMHQNRFMQLAAMQSSVQPTQGTPSTELSPEYYERDVNTLNQCFDEVERFVARIQSAYAANRELEMLRKQRGKMSSKPQSDGILQLRARLPTQPEFFGILQTFKFAVNLLGKLQKHIHDPSAAELIHFLMDPLFVILDACQWALGRNIGYMVVEPILIQEAITLLNSSLTKKERDVWFTLGDPWKLSGTGFGATFHAIQPAMSQQPVGGFGVQQQSECNQVLQQQSRFGQALPQQPGFYQAPAGNVYAPICQGGPPQPNDAAIQQVSAEMSKVKLEKEKLDFEREKIAEKERQIEQEIRKVEEEKRKLQEEKKHFYDEQEKRSVKSDGRSNPPQLADGGGPSEPYDRNYPPSDRRPRAPPIDRMSPRGIGRFDHGDRDRDERTVKTDPTQSRQNAFLEELRRSDSMVARVEYDRVGQNAQEMSVTKDEYLEILNSSRNWWHCRNAYNQVGYVPKTFLTVVDTGGPDYMPSMHSKDYRRPSVAGDMHTVAKERIGKYGGYRYF